MTSQALVATFKIRQDSLTIPMEDREKTRQGSDLKIVSLTLISSLCSWQSLILNWWKSINSLRNPYLSWSQTNWSPPLPTWTSWHHRRSNKVNLHRKLKLINPKELAAQPQPVHQSLQEIILLKDYHTVKKTFILISSSSRHHNLVSAGRTSYWSHSAQVQGWPWIHLLHLCTTNSTVEKEERDKNDDLQLISIDLEL